MWTSVALQADRNHRTACDRPQLLPDLRQPTSNGVLAARKKRCSSTEAGLIDGKEQACLNS
jgi:hypothetical protein